MSLFGYTDPWSDLRDMQRQMDRLMGFVGGDITSDVPLLTTGRDVGTALAPRVGTGAGQLAQWNPSMDIKETDKCFLVHAELPGCNKDDIKLSIDNNRLVVEGQKRTHKKEKGENWVRKERFEGSFYRTLPLPRGVDANQIQANYQDGVLEVCIPKPAGALQKQSIDIKTGAPLSSTSGQQITEGQEKGKGQEVPIGGERGQK